MKAVWKKLAEAAVEQFYKKDVSQAYALPCQEDSILGLGGKGQILLGEY